MRTMSKSAKKFFAAAACISMLLVCFAGCNQLNGGGKKKPTEQQKSADQQKPNNQQKPADQQTPNTPNNPADPQKSSEKQLLEFYFETANNADAGLSKDVKGIVNEKKHSVTIEVPSGTDKTKLKASFKISDKAKLFIGTVEQKSGETMNDFSNITDGVKLTVKAEDGTTQEYTVKVYIEIKLVEFGFKQADNSALSADVKSHVGYSPYFGRIIVTKLPVGTPESSLATLKPYFTVSEGVTVSAKDVPLTSGVTPVDFSDLLNGVTFKLTAADGGSINYSAGTEIDLPNPPKDEVEEYFGSYYSEFTHPRYGKNKVVIVLEEKKVTLYSTAMSSDYVNVEWEKNADNTYTCTAYTKDKPQIKNLSRLGKYDFIKVGNKIQVKTTVMRNLPITAEKGQDFVWTEKSGYNPEIQHR